MEHYTTIMSQWYLRPLPFLYQALNELTELSRDFNKIMVPGNQVLVPGNQVRQIQCGLMEMNIFFAEDERIIHRHTWVEPES